MRLSDLLILFLHAVVLIVIVAIVVVIATVVVVAMTAVVFVAEVQENPRLTPVTPLVTVAPVAMPVGAVVNLLDARRSTPRALLASPRCRGERSWP